MPADMPRQNGHNVLQFAGHILRQESWTCCAATVESGEIFAVAPIVAAQIAANVWFILLSFVNLGQDNASMQQTRCESAKHIFPVLLCKVMMAPMICFSTQLRKQCSACMRWCLICVGQYRAGALCFGRQAQFAKVKDEELSDGIDEPVDAS